MSEALIRIARDCWVPQSQADILAGRCQAVLNSCPDDAVISSVTAARLWGLWLPSLPDEIHVATMSPDRFGRSMTRTQRPQFVAHRFRPQADDVQLINGLRVTSVARTWRSLAPLLGLADLVAAGDSALRSGVPVDQLVATVASAGRAPFIRRAREALGLLDARSRSRPESHLRLIVVRAGVLEFTVNGQVSRAEGGWLSEPDIAIEAAKLALEYQGEDHAQKKRMRKDITRTGDMRRNAWEVWPQGPAEVFGRPWQLEAEIREHVRRYAPHVLGRRRKLGT